MITAIISSPMEVHLCILVFILLAENPKISFVNFTALNYEQARKGCAPDGSSVLEISKNEKPL